MVQRSTVKFSNPKHNFCYLRLADGRIAYLHRDDFQGNWPPHLHHTVLFTILIHNNHPRCEWRVKGAFPPEAAQ